MARNDPRKEIGGGLADGLAERLRSALEVHLAFWPFEVRPAGPGQVSLDVSSLHPFVVRRFELDSISCRFLHERLIVEFLARGRLRNAMLASGLHVLFEAEIPGLQPSCALQLGSRVELPVVFTARRLSLVHPVSVCSQADSSRAPG